MKKCIFLFAVIFVFSTCKNNKEDIEELGERAGKKMCECYKLEDKEKRDECFEALQTKYRKYENNDIFIRAFENAFYDCMIASMDDGV